MRTLNKKQAFNDMVNSNNNQYKNHRCKILMNPDGKVMENPVEQRYVRMTESKDEFILDMKYIGYGECTSAFDTLEGKRVPLKGKGHFWISE